MHAQVVLRYFRIQCILPVKVRLIEFGLYSLLIGIVLLEIAI
jgi:hypothetical protein